jgi:ABC-type branched-subunit amino acid transport system permease subunit
MADADWWDNFKLGLAGLSDLGNQALFGTETHYAAQTYAAQTAEEEVAAGDLPADQQKEREDALAAQASAEDAGNAVVKKAAHNTLNQLNPAEWPLWLKVAAGAVTLAAVVGAAVGVVSVARKATS